MSGPGQDETHDYVVVGAGSAGCVVANRLARAGHSVLLLEAGGWDRDPLIHIPLGIGKIFPERRHDWNYFMASDPALDGRGIECARGRVVGGSSSVNVMAYVRGHRSDYDRWAAAGLPGWDYAGVLPYFRRSEQWAGGADTFRGGSGPLRVQESQYRDPILDSFMAAGARVGFAATADYNGARQEGFARVQETIHAGRRCSAARAYLRPALRLRRLRVVVGAQAERVLLRDGVATGIAYRRNGLTRVAMARREVVLCAGVIDTPKLLMLSGIGDPAELVRLGIAVRAELPGVGRNLQDHLSVLVTHRRRDPSPFLRAMRYDRLAGAMARSLLGGGGFAGDVPIGVTAFLPTRPALAAPDIQFLFLAAPFPAWPYMRPWRQPARDGYGCRVVLLRPGSRGRVTLASADPAQAPVITPNFLSAPGDMDGLLAGLGLLRRVLAQPEMAAHDGGEVVPGPQAATAEELERFVRGTAVTVHHPAGTCRMGPPGDVERVVDAELRVCGVGGLRIADASVMPDMVGGNINGVVIMIAEKLADMILRGVGV